MKLLAALIMLSLLAVASFAQAEPANWQRYKVAEHSLSVMLPKVPMLWRDFDVCNSKDFATYFAYSEGSVYELTIVTKLMKKGPEYKCNWIRHKFDQDMLEARLGAMRFREFGFKESTGSLNGKLFYKFEKRETVRWIVPQFENNRWIELAVYHYPDSPPADLERFMNSAEQASTNGIEIGEGAAAMIGDKIRGVVKAAPVTLPGTPAPSGDAKVVTLPTAPGEGTTVELVASSDRITNALRVIWNPQPFSTDASRAAKIEGTVVLRVILLANGSVGSISVVKGLSHGLTERAIEAAKRIVFLPKQMNDFPVSSTFTVEYKFTKY